MTNFRALCAQFVELWDADCDTDVEINELLVELRAALAEPEPQSLKEQALVALSAIALGANDIREFYQDIETIKSALETLPNN